MTKYIDHAQALAKQERALEQAKERLKARGIYYPICDSRLSDSDNYERLMKYSALEAEEIVKILREPSGPRPLEKDTVEPKKTWGNSYYD